MFASIRTEVRYVTQRDPVDPMFPSIMPLLVAFDSLVSRSSIAARRAFIDVERNNLQTIYTFLTEFAVKRVKSFEDYLNTPPIRDKLSKKFAAYNAYVDCRKKLMSLTERIFRLHLNLPIHRGKIPLGTTLLFEKFLKGITIFKDQEDGEFPAYHRTESCGPYVGNDTFRKGNRQCLVKDITDVHRRKRIAQTCFIERMVYDALYANEMLADMTHYAKQDEGHQRALNDAKQDFSGCFPGQSLQVFVAFEARAPVSLRIERYKGNQLYETEVYTRVTVPEAGGSWSYDAIVTCEKINKGLVKYQSYFSTADARERWVKSSSGSMPASDSPQQVVNMRRTA